MKTFKINLPLYIVCLLIVLSSCSQPFISHWIDNPTDKEITLTIDGTSVTIPPDSGVHHEFEYGKHTLTYNGTSVNFIVKPSQMRCFINPTQSNYIFYKNIYMNEADENATEDYKVWLMKQITSETTININDSVYTLPLPFQVVSDLFIEKSNFNWDYYLDEDIPANVILRNALVTRRNRSLANDENYKAGKFQTVKSKIFRENDFLNYLRASGVNEKISFPSNTKRFNELNKVRMVDIDLDGITCPPGRDAVKSVLEHWDKWLTMTGKDFSDEYDNYISVTWQKDLKPSLANECYNNHNGDNTYKQAAAKIMEVLNPLYNISFFVVD